MALHLINANTHAHSWTHNCGLCMHWSNQSHLNSKHSDTCQLISGSLQCCHNVFLFPGLCCFALLIDP